MSAGQVSMLCIGFFVLVFVVLMVVSIVSARKRKQQVSAAATHLGFSPLAEADPELLSRLSSLYRPYPLRKVSNVFRKPFGNETYYIFDCQTDNPSRNTDVETTSSNEFGNVGIVSPALDLPAFMLMPRFPAMPMGLSGMLENLLSLAAINAGLSEYTLVTPAFSARYMLFVKEDARVEKVFTNEVQDWIARQEQLVARGENDFLLYNRYNLRLKNNKEVRQFSELVDGARQLCDFLVTQKS